MSDIVAPNPIISKIIEPSTEGATLYDVTSLLQDRKSLRVAIDQLASHFANANIQKVVGIEARGFIMGAALAKKLGVSFVLVRRKGKLPAKTADKSVNNTHQTPLEVHTDAIRAGERILLVDDLIGSGGSMLSAFNLMQHLKADVAGCGFIINLAQQGGLQRLNDLGVNTHALWTVEGD